MAVAIGTTVRALLGVHERKAAELYRRVFLDLDALVNQLARSGTPARILEVGCGEGQMTWRLARAFPNAQILAIDISPRVGRLFEGPPARVQFRCCAVAELGAELPPAFDLITLCDVLHHVPVVGRVGLLSSIRELLSDGGTFCLKDWERRQTPIHWACALSDRYITGDEVQYCTLRELQDLLALVFPQHAIVTQPSAPPWQHNRILYVQKPAETRQP